ncbi:suppressor of fused domain protein [Tomitella cavernea]|uniref:Type VII secretion system immunity protein YqcF n=1 Tax=Tomitella cavernea TaxID=1387982 RepID=A0ABP9CN40_9ACTN|nr:suppressor of fused domain protein [Tomitella cavernea]
MDLQETTRRVQEGLAVETKVVRFRDGAREGEPEGAGPAEVTLLVADGSPALGFASYSTVDMARFPTNVADDAGRRVASELITVGRAGQREFSDLLAACAFAVAGGSLHVTPLAMIPDAVEASAPGHATRHVLLVPPFIWPELPIVVEEDADDAAGLRAQVTTWLQVVPISDGEFRYATDHGAQSLFDRLERAGADVSDLDRVSVI